MTIRLAKADEANEIANIYIASFKSALTSVQLAHTDDEIRDWFEKVFVPKGGTWVGDDAAKLVGFMSLDGDMLEELYLAPDALGVGVGSALMEKAKQLSPAGLKTYTFQVNTLARKFYEKHDFTVVGLVESESTTKL